MSSLQQLRELFAHCTAAPGMPGSSGNSGSGGRAQPSGSGSVQADASGLDAGPAFDELASTLELSVQRLRAQFSEVASQSLPAGRAGPARQL